MAREWAEDFSSDVVDHVTVIVEEIETGQHRRLEVFVRYQPDENEPGMKEGVAFDAGSGVSGLVHRVIHVKESIAFCNVLSGSVQWLLFL